MSSKSKLGCRTCRVRKVKCDETLPVCQRCFIAGRHCDGPSRGSKFVYVNKDKRRVEIARHARTQPLFSPCSTIPELDASEARCFDHFLHRVAPVLSEGADASLWRSMLPQISHEDRAIRDAVLVISQLYEQPPVYAWTQVDAQERAHKFPVKWYTRSLSGFRSRMANLETPADYELALLSCLLFATIEFQQVNVSNACNLLQCGLSMIKDGYQRNAKSFTLPDSSLVRIRQMFARQRFLMAIFGHDTPGGFHDVSAALTHDSESSPVTLAKTKEELFDCLYDTMRLLQAARVAEVQQLHDRKDHLSIERASVLNNLELWHQNFSWVWQTRDMQGTLQDTQEEITANISLIYYETALCWTCTCLESEDTTDKYMSNFERIIELSEKVIQQKQELGLASTPFSFELGTIAPLWLTGWKCRDPDLRRKALQLLRRGSKQEALFSAPLHAKALEKVIEIEEKRGNVPSTRREGHIGWLSLPEPRVRNITVQYETKEGKKVEPALIYDIESSKSEGDLTLVQKTIPL